MFVQIAPDVSVTTTSFRLISSLWDATYRQWRNRYRSNDQLDLEWGRRDTHRHVEDNEITRSDSPKMLMWRTSLNSSLNRETDPSNTEPFQNLHDNQFRQRISTLPETNHQAKCQSLDRETPNDDPLDSPEVAGRDSREDGNDSSCE